MPKNLVPEKVQQKIPFQIRLHLFVNPLNFKKWSKMLTPGILNGSIMIDAQVPHGTLNGSAP